MAGVHYSNRLEDQGECGDSLVTLSYNTDNSSRIGRAQLSQGRREAISTR